MVMHFSGQITESFDREFRCLYADSQIIDCFHNPDEESLPYYPYPVTAPNMGLDFFPERSRNRERVLSSENSSSQSSCSMSSIKAAPGMTNTVYKVTQGHDKKETSNSHLSPERRGGALTPSLHNQTAQGTRGSPNGTNHSPVTEHASSGIGQSGGIEWSKSIPTELRQPNVGGTTSKFQTLGLYDQKSSLFNSSPKTQSPMPDSKLSAKQRTTSNPILNKLTDLFLPPTKKDFLPPTEKDTYIFRRSPPHSTAFGGPDLSQTEPESEQTPPPPPPMINRKDQKRMTLGHSKLDLVNHYNKMKSKQVYSRFELKNNN